MCENRNTYTNLELLKSKYKLILPCDIVLFLDKRVELVQHMKDGLVIELKIYAYLFVSLICLLC